MKFLDLGLNESILRAVSSKGYTDTTPIQEQSIPHVMAGRDVLGCAQTGTGKTASFALPILHRLLADNVARQEAAAAATALAAAAEP
ncbi:MAG: DEAD/DEAH box helicase, partial [Planctomycetota bacterium]|nr:DEAD/DEAH box helicase [Planctomycetota bacterium]